MAFCGQCGVRFEDDMRFCPACGAPAAGTAQQGAPAYRPPVAPGAPVREEIRDAQDNKAMAVLAYIIFLIPLLAARESPFARYHTNQGLVLFLLCVVWGIVYAILTTIFFAISISLGLIFTTVLGLTFILPTVLCVVGIIHACKGEWKPLPVIGDITILK